MNAGRSCAICSVAVRTLSKAVLALGGNTSKDMDGSSRFRMSINLIAVLPFRPSLPARQRLPA